MEKQDVVEAGERGLEEEEEEVVYDHVAAGEGEEYELTSMHEVLPLEVMQHIMGMADPASVARAESVCRAWRSACESPFVWEAVFRRHFSSSPTPAAKEKWRVRCVKAAISLRRLQALEGEGRLRETLRWCAACGHDRVLRELLTNEAAHMTLDLLNGKRPPNTDEDKYQYSDDGSARPLHLAASVGCAEVVDLLALAGADVNVANGRGQTPVGVAAAKGFLDVVEVLLRHGAGGSDFTRLIQAQQNLGTRKGPRPLSFQAAAGGHIKIMEVLMEKAGGPEKARALINAVEPRTGNTALHFAADNGHCAMVAFLLKHGADKNALNGSKQTALHLATLAGCVPAVQMLVEHGAQILFTAAEAKTKKVPISPLHLAAANRSEALVSLFVELGLDINLTDAAGRIPLHFAARAVPKSVGFIEFLLARGANAKAVDEEGQGVLHYALTNECSAGLVEMCKRLIDAGADALSKDPILSLVRILSHWYSQSESSLDLVNLFVEHGVNVQEPRIGTALLTAAAQSFHYDLVAALLDLGVDPNASVVGAASDLPLHAALARHSHFHNDVARRRVIELLLEKGADVNRPSGYDGSPALFSLSYEPDETLDFLLSRGADINARNGRGETFLYQAVHRGWPYWETQLDRMRQTIVGLIERGADPGQCRVDGQGPVSEVGVGPSDTVGWEWITFLRSVGIPVQTQEDSDAADAEAAGHQDDSASPNDDNDDGVEGRAEPLGHAHHRNDDDDDDANEDEEEEDQSRSRSKGKEKLDG